MRLSHAFLCLVLFTLGCFVYSTANHYQKTERKMAKIERSIDREYENIRVLKAEWAFLTSPQRLEKLARDYLALQAMSGAQLVAASSVPLRESMESLAVKDMPAQENNRGNGLARPVSPAMPTLEATPVNAGARP